jgi:hypothetical protein
MEKARYLYDVFISHAVEDKIPIANELYRRLEQKNLKVWYSGSELSVGDRLTESIHTSLHQCRFGVVIISPTYLSKIWALNEFFFLLTKEKDGQKVILPVLYDITPEQLAYRSTLMAEMFAVRADRGLDHVTEKLYQEIQKQRAKDAATEEPVNRLSPNKKRIAVFLMILLILIVGIISLRTSFHDSPERAFIEQVIQKRIDEVQQRATNELKEVVHSPNAKIATTDEIKKAYLDFLDAKSIYHSDYTLYTTIETIHSEKNVNAALSLDIKILTPLNLYDLTAPKLYRILLTPEPFREEKLVFYSAEGVSFRFEESAETPGHHNAKVYYENPIRLVSTTLILPKSTQVKRQQVTITALRPIETYTFVSKKGQWLLESTE